MSYEPDGAGLKTIYKHTWDTVDVCLCLKQYIC